MRLHPTVPLALAATLALAALPAHAGRSCDARPPDARTITRAMQLARQTAEQLDASGAQVVLLARAGQDLTRYGLHWSHMAWAWRTPEGRWRVTHKLNDCGTARAHLWRQGLGEFFMDDLWRYEAVWAVPAPAVQAQLAALLADAARSTALQHQPYSMVSYAWGTRYQQSNQWAIETLAAAMQPEQVRTRGQAQQWLRAQGYVPTALALGPLTRLGARVASANVAFDDHPTAQRMAGHIETVTVDSVLAWLVRAQLAQPPRTLVLTEVGSS
ncbi:DUF2145 domain-containing protein [Pulveribacter suum]|uniref:DUF2145 domain-containing protein n=1 Tax=Pulveribacter suum TaxID=2116657 RepID=A0A2P1NIC1_9BURK|nr:DUF2145 domain-containing protein [Pulveribacter suum]AVP56804.1 DUF2145 domain-containing protein [Pulveribacter suum]